jgi:hypothetical protein
VVATERADEIQIARRSEPNDADILAQAVQEIGEPKGSLAGRRRQHHAPRAEKFLLGEKIVDQKRQHKDWTQQGLIVALPSGIGGIVCDARIGVIDWGDA